MESTLNTESHHRIHPTTLAHARDLRRNLTPAERKLWARLRGRQLGGIRFRRQAPVGPFVADFYCAEVKVIIELDGHSHAEQVAYDDARTAWLNAHGYRVIRYTNGQVEREMEAVLQEIDAVCQKLK